MYRFIFFKKWFNMAKQTRIINLQGQMGSGKTLLSVALGYHFLREGYVERFSSNFPVGFAAEPMPRWSFNVMDEAGVFFDNRSAFKDKSLNQMTAGLTFGLRKAGSYLIFPSFLGADKRFRAGLRMWRTWSFGNRLWIYHWEVGEETTEERREGVNYWQGRLVLVGPSHFFNVYDTYYKPIANMTLDWARKLMVPWETLVPAYVYEAGYE